MSVKDLDQHIRIGWEIRLRDDKEEHDFDIQYDMIEEVKTHKT